MSRTWQKRAWQKQDQDGRWQGGILQENPVWAEGDSWYGSLSAFKDWFIKRTEWQSPFGLVQVKTKILHLSIVSTIFMLFFKVRNQSYLLKPHSFQRHEKEEI